ncbi:protein mono-ADP-ribosyltransferase PARP14-like [Saccoglossus kowalevskii]
MVSDLEERKNVTISKEHNSVLIICFKTDVDMVMCELNTFIRAHTTIEDIVEAENGKLRYISEYKKDDIIEIQITSRVKIMPQYNGPMVGFLLKGTKNDVKTARAKVQKLIDDIHGYHHQVDKPGVPKLFKEEKGKYIIKIVENEINCKIDINDPSEIEIKGAGEKARNHIEEFVCQNAIHGGRSIVVSKGDLTKMDVDVVVNPANTSLSYTGGLSKAIAEAGGPAIKQESETILREQYGVVHSGQVVHTTSGKMPCKRIIHAVGPSSNKVTHQSRNSPVWDLYSQEENLLTDAVQNSLALAEELGYSSIGIPAISSGTLGFPLDMCTKTIVSAVDDWAENTQPGILVEIRLVDISDKTCESFKNAMLKHFGEDKFTLTADDTSTPSPLGHRHKRKIHGGRLNRIGQQAEDIKTARNIRTTHVGLSSHGIQVTSNKGEISVRGGKTVRLVKGSISAEKVDVIVNTTRPTLDLDTGAVSKSILQAAGVQLQQEINNKTTSGVSTNEGDIIITSGGNTQCNNIYHVICCKWNNNNTSKASQVLGKIMQNCLNTAAQSDYKSIAFPAIGTGGLGFPGDATAKIMYEEVIAYINANPSSSVSDIRFVVYDFLAIQAFEDEIGRWNSYGGGSFSPMKQHKKKEGFIHSGHQRLQGASGYNQEKSVFMQFKEKSRNNGDCQMVIGKILVQLQEGDITNETTEAIVNSSNRDLDLKLGAVSQAILKKGGQSIVTECQNLGRQPADTVVMTGAGYLKCNKILHMISPYTKLEDSVIKMLKFAEIHKLKSIAIPAVGAGILELAPKNVAHDILNAISEFVQQCNPRFLEVIRITIFQSPLVAIFNDEMKSMIGTPMKHTRGILGRARGVLKYIFGGSDNSARVKMIDTIILHIYADSQDVIKNAITKIDELVGLEYIDTTITKETVKKLTNEDMSEINKVAEPLEVNVQKINTGRVERLAIQGVSQSVMHVHNFVNVILDRISAEEGRKREAMLLAKNVTWKFHTNSGDFEAYEDEICGIIEQARHSGNPHVDFEIERRTYRIIFKEMIEVDLDDLSTGEVKRELKEGGVPLPSSWTTMADNETVKVEYISATSNEYQTVEKRFKTLLWGTNSNVIKIERVQNPRLYRQYMILKQDMDAKNPAGTDNERILYHGTKGDSVDKINHDGFNRSFCGKNATVYGEGSYFALDSKYSARSTYSPVDSNGQKHVYQCKVLTGVFTVGHESLVIPPYKNPNKSYDRYDSVVDDEKNPKIFVVFNDAMAYPEYNITFK